MGVIMSALGSLGGMMGSAAGAASGAMSTASGAISGLGGMAEGALSGALGADNVGAIKGAMGQADQLGTLLGGGGGSSPAPAPSQVPTSKVGVQAAPAISGDGALGAGMSAEDIRNATRKRGLF